MERHIRLGCDKQGDYWTIQIEDQTHIGGSFGNPYDTFSSSKRFHMTSCTNPALHPEDNQLYVQGDDDYGNDCILNVYEDTTLQHIMHVVREYNSHLTIDKLPAIPNDETFTIE